MGQDSNIEWTHHTANLVFGCEKVSIGCQNCYAEAFSKRFDGRKSLWGGDAYRREIKSVWSNLDRFQRNAAKSNEVHRVFVGSMMDVFEKPMPIINSKGELQANYNSGNLRFHLFYRIDRGDYPNLMFLFLTKRPSNINKYIFDSWKTNPPKNVMFGTSPVNQKTFNNLVGHLNKVNGKKFLSIEPQLDKIELGNLTGIDWIINGGESGHHKRPFNVEWARSLRDECKELKIPFFFKQIDKIQKIPSDLNIKEFPSMDIK